MTRICVLAILGSIPLLMAGAPRADSEPPAWAYNIGPPPPHGAPPAPPARDDGKVRRLPDSGGAFTLTQIRDAFGPADWYPGDHPAMPDVVARGRRPDVQACSLCHYPNGKGRPENAGISGQPVAYFVQTMADFRNGARRSAEPRNANTNIMTAIAKAMTDQEVKAAAEYFGSMKWTPWIKVVEADTVPKTRVQGGVFLRLAKNETEPIGGRLIETPVDTERTELLRDPRSGFIAYVPPGSLKKGEALVKGGTNGKSTQCAVCHGPDLKGVGPVPGVATSGAIPVRLRGKAGKGSGPVPGIAGRSPSYAARQLYDMQHGARKGLWAELMMPALANLTNDDLLAIAAYTASLAP